MFTEKLAANASRDGMLQPCSRPGAKPKAMMLPVHPPQEAEELALRRVIDVYQRMGGLASGDQVASMLRCEQGQPISTLAKWIVSRKVISLVWKSQLLLPLFQFDRADMSPRAEVLAVAQELSRAFDDWELAAWFASPNSWLCDALPAELVLVDHARVMDAARADRFIALG